MVELQVALQQICFQLRQGSISGQHWYLQCHVGQHRARCNLQQHFAATVICPRKMNFGLHYRAYWLVHAAGMSMQTGKRCTSHASEDSMQIHTANTAANMWAVAAQVHLTRQHAVDGAVQKPFMCTSGHCNKGVMAACKTDLWYRLSGSADYAGQLRHGQTDRPIHLAVLAPLC